MKKTFKISRTDCGLRLVRFFDQISFYNIMLIESLGLVNNKITVSTEFTKDHEFVLRLKDLSTPYEYEIWQNGELLDETICLCGLGLRKYFKDIPILLFISVKE